MGGKANKEKPNGTGQARDDAARVLWQPAEHSQGHRPSAAVTVRAQAVGPSDGANDADGAGVYRQEKGKHYVFQCTTLDPQGKKNK